MEYENKSLLSRSVTWGKAACKIWGTKQTEKDRISNIF